MVEMTAAPHQDLGNLISLNQSLSPPHSSDCSAPCPAAQSSNQAGAIILQTGGQKLCSLSPLTVHPPCSVLMAQLVVTLTCRLGFAQLCLCGITRKGLQYVNPNLTKKCPHNPVLYIQEPRQPWNCHLVSDLWALFWSKTPKPLWVTYWWILIHHI